MAELTGIEWASPQRRKANNKLLPRFKSLWEWVEGWGVPRLQHKCTGREETKPRSDRQPIYSPTWDTPACANHRCGCFSPTPLNRCQRLNEWTPSSLIIRKVHHGCLWLSRGVTPYTLVWIHTVFGRKGKEVQHSWVNAEWTVFFMCPTRNIDIPIANTGY